MKRLFLIDLRMLGQLIGFWIISLMALDAFAQSAWADLMMQQSREKNLATNWKLETYPAQTGNITCWSTDIAFRGRTSNAEAVFDINFRCTTNLGQSTSGLTQVVCSHSQMRSSSGRWVHRLSGMTAECIAE